MLKYISKIKSIKRKHEEIDEQKEEVFLLINLFRCNSHGEMKKKIFFKNKMELPEMVNVMYGTNIS